MIIAVVVVVVSLFLSCKDGLHGSPRLATAAFQTSTIGGDRMIIAVACCCVCESVFAV
jgi:hypothetical protein